MKKTTLRELIVRSMNEGCPVVLTQSATKAELKSAQQRKEPSSIDSFLANVEDELIATGWKESPPTSDIEKEYDYLKEVRFFKYQDRLAFISKQPDDLDGNNKIATFQILSTIDYEVYQATTEPYMLSFYRYDITTSKAKAALIKCGWVVTKPNEQIANAYADFAEALYFEKGNMFAVTGIQSISSCTPTGIHIKTVPAIIINCKDNFDE